jgi:hypothetical protein
MSDRFKDIAEAMRKGRSRSDKLIREKSEQELIEEQRQRMLEEQKQKELEKKKMNGTASFGDKFQDLFTNPNRRK